MDLLSFDAEPLYFDNPPSEEVVQLLQQATEDYKSGASEECLRRAYNLAPENLMVLVTLFRYYFYQQRFTEATIISQQARAVVRHQLGLPDDWREMSEARLFGGNQNNMVMVRFYLLCLKGEAYMLIRQGQFDEGTALLNKIIEMDAKDHLAATALLAIVNRQSDPAIQP